ncbi:MAG: SUMF1/EgtB/PvdO family nonheme iron enzyme [Saprospiraceae bacterium]|nr:SUMF1/EgtB/PvdO family nonheme iron enzyme [Saprospiraceae bacterium]
MKPVNASPVVNRFSLLLLAIALLLMWKSWQTHVEANVLMDLAIAKTKEAEASERNAKNEIQLARSEQETVVQNIQAAQIIIQKARVDSLQAEVVRKKAEANTSRRHRKSDDQLKKNQKAVEETLKLLEEEKIRLAKLFLEQSYHYRFQLNYGKAYEQMAEAVALGVASGMVSDSLLEFAYWYAETGTLHRAWGIMDTVYLLRGDSLHHGQGDRLGIRTAIEALSRTRFQALEARYYPKMVDIPGGTDSFGSVPIRVSPFQMAETETTWWQYGLYCKSQGLNFPAKEVPKGDHPVVKVSWYEAVAYTQWLNQRLGHKNSISGTSDNDYSLDTTIIGYRLPTEIEWEFAARAQKRTKYAGSDTLELVGWFEKNSGGRTHPVKRLRTNAFYLYDMSGNALEWCWDWGDTFPDEVPANYHGPQSGTERVFRGGNSVFGASLAEVGRRYDDVPAGRFDAFGFRVAR